MAWRRRRCAGVSQETVEPARVVHIRTEEILSSDNLFAQVTVRLHTKQVGNF